MKPGLAGTRRLAAALLLAISGLLVPAAAPAAEGDALAIVGLAAADPALRATLAAEGREAGEFCANCHGEEGLSRFPQVPNLAGQHPAYVVTQVEAFLSGKRKDDFMEGLMKMLSERQKAAIALHYAQAEVEPALAAPGAGAARGGELYQKICARCHQEDAGGAETYPRLAGQQQEYLRTSLTRYLEQSGERYYAPMTAAVIQLGAPNIDAVTEYLASLK